MLYEQEVGGRGEYILLIIVMIGEACEARLNLHGPNFKLIKANRNSPTLGFGSLTLPQLRL